MSASGHNSRSTDAELARAFLDLEGAVSDLRHMTALMETAVDDTLGPRGGALHDLVAQRCGVTSEYRVLVLTTDQADGLEYALRHMGDLTRALYRSYHAGYETKAG